MKKLLATVMLIFVIGGKLSGCQKNPESSIVVNKDMDQLIEKAQDLENGTTDVGELAKQYTSYQTTIADDSLYVNIDVDAQVTIPNVESLSVLRVKQHNVTQSIKRIGDCDITDCGNHGSTGKCYGRKCIRHHII